MELQAVTGQLYTLDGEPQQTTKIPGLLAQSPPAKAVRGRSHDFLFIHLSLSGQPDEYESLALDLLDTINNHFYSTPGSVTAALRTAIIKANQLLLRLNVSGTSPVREGAITCAVLRGRELYVVQAGEAFALIGHNFGIERLPAQEPENVKPMGRTAGMDLRYYHNWLQPGDMLLLADPRITHIVADELKPVLIDSTVEDSLPQLAQLLGEETARLLLVEFTDETPVGIPETVIALAEQASAAPSARTLDPPTEQPLRERPTIPHKEPDPEGRAARRAPSIPLPEIELPSAQAVEDTARLATSRTALGLARLTRWFADLMQRLHPPVNRKASSTQISGWALPAVLAITIPIIVAVIVGGVYIQRGKVTRMSEIRREMQQELGIASQIGEESEARMHYLRVLQLAAEAERLHPGDEEIRELRGRAIDQLDQIDGATRLTATKVYEYEPGSRMTALVLREGLNGDIFTLDSANNRVFVHDTAEDYLTPVTENPREIIFGGQAIGSHIVGRLVDMVWRSSGTNVSSEGLAVLDADGALVTYHPSFSNVRAVPLGLASDWIHPTGLVQFSERIYVVDIGAGQLWRYFPEGEGFYVDEAQRALSLPDANQVVDVAIYSEDGSIIAVYVDGRVRRYGQDSLLWDEGSLSERGLDSPFVAPTQVEIVGTGLNSSIFVADPGSSRIVQLSLGGTFLAQYKATEAELDQELFAKLGDFAVAENPLRIFVVAENGLYVARQD